MQDKLTSQEQTILDLLIAGTSPKEIGYQLNISYDTVKYHRKNLYEKLGVNSIQELFGKYAFAKTADEKESLTLKPLPCPFVLTPNDNTPYGWKYIFDPDVFQYNGEYYPSPFKLGKGNRLTEGDMYHVTCFFTANVDIDYLLIFFADTTIEEEEFEAQLSGMHKLGNFSLKANTRHNLSTKIFLSRTASGTSSAENIFFLSIGKDSIEPPVLTFHKFEVIKLPQQNILKSSSLTQRQLSPSVLPTPNPLVITLDYDDDARWGGWKYLIEPDVFIYKGKKTASPFILGKENRIVEDDIFLVNMFFTSNADMDMIQIVFIDNTIEADNNWTQLSPYFKLKKNIKAGIENNITIKVLATKTASGTSPAENQFILMAGYKTKEQPTLTFTKFEVVKI